MKLQIDKQSDALRRRLNVSPILESAEASPGVVLDYNETNQVVGIKILHLSKRSPNLNLATPELITA